MNSFWKIIAAATLASVLAGCAAGGARQSDGSISVCTYSPPPPQSRAEILALKRNNGALFTWFTIYDAYYRETCE